MATITALRQIYPFRKKNIFESCNKRSISTLLKRSERYELKKKTCFLSFQRTLSVQKRFAEWKLTLWEYLFGPKRFLEKPCACQLADCQEQICYKENLHHQETPGNVLVKSSKNTRRRHIEPPPKLPPSFKLPKAILLNSAMMEGFPEGDRNCEAVTTSRKPYEEMKLVSNIKRITKYQKNIRSEDTKSYSSIYEKSTSRISIPIISLAEARDTTMKILRQAMAQEEPRMHSRIEQLKILVNEKRISRASQIDSECKHSNK